MVSATLRAFCCQPVFELPLLKELDAHFHTIICDMDVPVHGHFQTGMAKELLQSLRACLISQRVRIGEIGFLSCKAKSRSNPDGLQGFLTQSGRKICRQGGRGEMLNRLLGALPLRACLKTFDKNGGVGENRKKQAGAGENASIPK